MYGIEKPSLVLNCPEYRKYEKYDLFREKLGIGKDKTIFLYQGAYFPGRGVEKLIDIFDRLESKDNKQVLVLLVYGDKIEFLKDKIRVRRIFIGMIKFAWEVYMEYVASADWGYILWKIPAKITIMLYLIRF